MLLHHPCVPPGAGGICELLALSWQLWDTAELLAREAQAKHTACAGGTEPTGGTAHGTWEAHSFSQHGGTTKTSPR